MAELTIQEKMKEFVIAHRELAGVSPERVLSVMVESGVISHAEYEQAKNNSVFNTQGKTDNTIGVSVERQSSYQKDVPPPPAQITLNETQCKEVAIQIIDENITDAYSIFNSQNLGAITRAYDEYWKNEDDKLATSNVKKVLDYQKAGEIQIIEAKNGNLTRRAYYEENKQRIKEMILTRLNVLKTPTGVSFMDSLRGKFSKKQMTEIIERYIENICNNAEIDKLKEIQKQFVSFSAAEEAQALKNFVDSAKTYEKTSGITLNTLGGEGKPRRIKGPDKGLVPSYWDSAEPITFEEVYKLERGQEYSQYAVTQYKQAKAEMETVVSAFNKKQQFVDFAEGLRQEQLSSQEKTQKLIDGFAAFYLLSEDGGLSQLQKIIEKSNLPILLDEKALNLSAFGSEEAKTRALNSLLKIAAQEKEKDFETFLGGKSIEEYQLAFENASNDIIGEENSKMLADAMKNDNLTVIQRWTGNTSMAGMGLTLIGGILCFTPAAPLGAALVTVGNGLAIGGMVTKTGLGVADYSTKDVKTSEELNELTKNFIMDAGGFIIGMGAGKAGMQAFSRLIDRKLVAVFGQQISAGNKAQALKTIFTNPEYLKSFMTASGAKLSTDFIISYAGDLAMMGILDTNDDWRSLLQANLTGVLVGISGDIKEAAGVRKPKIKTNQAESPATRNNFQEQDEVAPFAGRLERTPDIQDLTNPEIRRIELENGEFNEKGEFISDGTRTITESGNPRAKSTTVKSYDGKDVKIAQNFDELTTEICQLSGKKKLSNYEISKLKKTFENNANLTVSEFSAIIHDYMHATSRTMLIDDFNNFVLNFDGLLDTQNFKTLAVNISEFDKFMTEINNSENANTTVLMCFRKLRPESFSKDMASIKPEDFKKNLEIFKGLDSDLQTGLVSSNGSILLKKHDDKFFELIKAADEYNKFCKENSQADQKSLPLINYQANKFERLSDKEIVQVQKNLELLKDMISKGYYEYNLMNNILSDHTGKYTDLYARLKTELKDEIDFSYLQKLDKININNEQSDYDFAIKLGQILPEGLKVLNAYDLRILTGKYSDLDEAGKQTLLDKITIISKMPQLVTGYNDKIENSFFMDFLTQKEIKDTDKIVRFLELAEPAYLKQITLAYGNSYERHDFDKIFASENLDNMIKCAELHKELPQELIEYMRTEDSIIGCTQNGTGGILSHQYEVDANILAKRIKLINEYKDKMPVSLQERIYNGQITTSNPIILNMLCKMEPECALRFVGYARLDVLDQLPQETLTKFTNFITNSENITPDDISSNFLYYYTSKDDFAIFEKLTNEELDAISFNSLAKHRPGDVNLYIDKIRTNIAAVPKQIRDFIKNDIDISFYSDYMKLGDSNTASNFKKRIEELSKMSQAELENIGSKTIVEYLDSFRLDKKPFNPQNLAIWANVPQEIKAKLGEMAIYLLTSEDVIDIKLLNSRIEKLKEQNAFDELDNTSLLAILKNKSKEMEECLAEILADSSFDRKNLNSIVRNLQSIKNDTNDWDFVRELILNPKVQNNQISDILQPLTKRESVREQQKEFARYLIARDDVDNSIIPSLLYQMENIRSLENFNELKINFAKELLDNKNIKNEDIASILRLMHKDSFEKEKNFYLQMINSQKFTTQHIDNISNKLSNGWVEINPAKIDIAQMLLFKEGKDFDFTYRILNALDFQIEPELTLEIKNLIQDLLNNENLNTYTIPDIVSSISNNKTIAYHQIKLVKDLTKSQNIIYDIPSLLNTMKNNGNISPDILSAKIQEFISIGLDSSTIYEICNNAKVLSVFNTEVIGIIQHLQKDGAYSSTIIKAIFDNTISPKLKDKIDTLLILSKLTNNDKLILKKQGIYIDKKSNDLMKSIDTKYPIISTSKADVHEFLTHIGNNRGSDAVIQTADFEKFGKDGIPLEYTREDFMRNMDNIISEYASSRPNIDVSTVEIPELRLSAKDRIATKEKIEKLKAEKRTEEVEVIMNGQKLKGTRFLGTQGGSNTAYYTQIGDKLYYIKYPDTKKLGQSVEEVIASRLYRAAGIDSPNMEYVYNDRGEIIGMAGEYVPNLSATPHSTSQKTDGFATDAWLANWDAPKNDNTQYRTSGVIKVDVGGSMNYRARGELKDFGNVVNELSSLIEQNSEFLSMTKSELLSSLRHVTEMPEERIIKIIQDSPSNDINLVQTLLKRKEYMTIFAQKLALLDEGDFKNILEMVNRARAMTMEDFTDIADIAGMLGYTRTKTGFEGMLNTQNSKELNLTPEQQHYADRMKTEIEKFTIHNRIADDVDINPEARDFLNSILRGIPEFAAFFGKPQHSIQKYSLDIHILKVLQDSMNDPLYQKLGDTDKIVLKFSTLLHDIGKRYLADGSDTGHAAKSAEYVYSILDRFNLTPEVKDRIITTVLNHHWFKDYNTKTVTVQNVAAMCRRPEDFLIYQIMAKADLKNVNDTFYQTIMQASSVKEADEKFAQKMAEIAPYVQYLQEKQVVITASKFMEIPERKTQTGRILPARAFPQETFNLNGKDTTFRVLNLSNMDENTNMFQYGFNNITAKDLRFNVHMVDDRRALDIFETLSRNPMNNSVQSISMISMADKSTYCNRKFGLVLDIENADIGHAYYSNTSSGTQKGFNHFVEEIFENTKYRSFVKDSFIERLNSKGIEINDTEYAAITKYIMGKHYPETQIKSLKVGERIFSREDLLDAFLYSRDQLIDIKQQKTHGFHNEIVGLNSKVRGVMAKANSLEECPDWVLEFARDNDLPIILIGE